MLSLVRPFCFSNFVKKNLIQYQLNFDDEASDAHLDVVITVIGDKLH